jgi:hypothetical protein
MFNLEEVDHILLSVSKEYLRARNNSKEKSAIERKIIDAIKKERPEWDLGRDARKVRLLPRESDAFN